MRAMRLLLVTKRDQLSGALLLFSNYFYGRQYVEKIMFN